MHRKTIANASQNNRKCIAKYRKKNFAIVCDFTNNIFAIKTKAFFAVFCPKKAFFPP